MTLFESFDISGAEPIPLHREQFTNEKQRNKLLDRARTDKAASPFMQIVIVEVGKTTKTYPLEEA